MWLKEAINMSLNNSLIPWRWTKHNLPIRREDNEFPVFNSVIQHDFNQIFDDFFTGSRWPILAWEGKGIFEPCLDLTETEKELRVTVELPGLDEKDIDLSIANGALTIKGEKRQEKEDNIHGQIRVERSYGSFQRVTAVPCEINQDKVEATFKKGILTITLPKTELEQSNSKKIQIKKE
jgi:HSP20 family protein